ncbi:hypothetical protein BHE74_00054524 [Ensete ventricosum]|nr:hypothetical protein BHE74_00054524 [Ensete ventricosum]RZS28422.1 hypothetical protein BHM03_00062001 [Ensete ventricosum]
MLATTKGKREKQRRQRRWRHGWSSRIAWLWKLQRMPTDRCGKLQWEDVDGVDEMQTLPRRSRGEGRGQRRGPTSTGGWQLRGCRRQHRQLTTTGINW